MSRLLRRRRAQSVSVAPTVLAGEFQRWDAGTGATLTSLAVPLQQGQLTAANIANVSVWSGGSEIAAYVMPTGTYPDGSARTLFLQTSQTLTNGSPVAGEIRLTGGFTVSRRTYTDDSATWSNALTTTWRAGGQPAGAFVCTSVAHLCASNPFGPVVPQSSQPVFTGSVLVDTAFDAGYQSNITDETNGAVTGPAYYERVILLYNHYCRTGSVTVLRDCLAHASRVRTVALEPTTGDGAWQQPEQSQSPLSYLWFWLFRRDTKALDSIRLHASNAGVNVATWYNTDGNGGRFIARRLGMATGALIAGIGAETDRFGNRFDSYAAAIFPQALTTGTTSTIKADNTVQALFWDADGVTRLWVHLGYMAAMFCEAWRWYLSALPASANKTSMTTQLVASIAALESLATTNGGGLPVYQYQNVESFFAARTGTVATTYTSGTSITLTIPSMANELVYAPSAITIGGVIRRVAANVTADGTGTCTVTLTSGFPSGHSAGAAVALALQTAPAGGAGDVDLNGFFPHLWAWRATQTANVNDANRARALYAPLGGTPRNGTNGPQFIGSGKLFDESFYRSPLTLAFLQQSGL